MRTSRSMVRLARAAMSIGVLLGLPGLLAAQVQSVDDVVRRLPWRSIGPANQAGRVSVIVGIPGEPHTFYVAGANGGIFKTVDGGITYDTLFDTQRVLSIGDIAIAPSNPEIIYVGTGEGNPRNNASFGDGVYRSVDGGKHWTHLGLEDSDRIARIVVDDRNPDVAYVCALGHEWGPNEQRGLFKTTDGGKSWKKVLYLNTQTGCSDVAVHPRNSNVVYAGMYTFLRRPWHFSGGGGATGLFKSVDGGATWTKLTRGLPKGAMDRIGLSIARSNPSIVYMVSEAKGEGELWRTDDAGEHWRVVNRDPNINFRPFYYSDIRVDPNNPDRIFSLSGSLNLSEDGGRTFRRVAADIHGDHQALWIDPANSNRVLSGSDGGFQISLDGGKRFEVINNIAFTQFYHLTYDMQQPYMVCGGLQDNGHWCGPSRTTLTRGIRKRDWVTVSGGDGFHAVPQLDQPHLVYSAAQGGMIVITNTITGEQRSIHPDPNRIGSAGDAIADHKYRFNWNAPIVRSPHDPKTLYFGGNVLFRTTSAGQSWDVISPDLTANDKSKQQSSGGPVVVDNTAAEFYNTILAIAPSPVDPNVVWVGADDGRVHVTRDGGKSWTDVGKNIPGLGPDAAIPNIDASRTSAGTAYLAADRHRNDDYAPYAYKTTDFGKTWVRITTGLPRGAWVHVVREDPKNRSLLYAGTELGIFASWDGGARWISIRGGLPPVPVHDLFVHPRDNDLVIATHGRGAYVLDDATPLQELGRVAAASELLFDIRPATRWITWDNDADLGEKEYIAANPPYGALINYHLGSKPAGDVTITITDRRGQTIRTITNAPQRVGLNQAVWDLRHESAWEPDTAPRGSAPRQGMARRDTVVAPDAVTASGITVQSDDDQVRSEPAGRGGGFFGRRQGLLALPGEYTVTLAANGKQLSKPVRVVMDPRVVIADADLEAQLAASMSMRELGSRVNRILYRTNDLVRQLTALSTQLTQAAVEPVARSAGSGGAAAAAAPASGVAEVKRAIERLTRFRDDELTRPIPGLGYRQYPRLREEVQSLTRMIDGPVSKPTDAQLRRMGELTREIDKAAATLEAIIGSDIANINALFGKSPRIVVGGDLMM